MFHDYLPQSKSVLLVQVSSTHCRLSFSLGLLGQIFRTKITQVICWSTCIKWSLRRSPLNTGSTIVYLWYTVSLSHKEVNQLMCQHLITCPTNLNNQQIWPVKKPEQTKTTGTNQNTLISKWYFDKTSNCYGFCRRLHLTLL